MTLRMRIALVAVGVMVAVLLILLLFDRFFLTDRFEEIERAEVRLDVERVLRAVDSETARLGIEVLDWSSWDDTYDFVQTRAPGYVRSNLPADILETMELGAFVLLDLNGRIIESRIAPPAGQSGAVPDLRDGAPMLRALFERARRDDMTGGVVQLSNVPMLITVRPVLRSDGSGAPVGILMFGRWLDDDRMEQLSAALATPMQFRKPADAPDGLLEADADGESIRVVSEDSMLVGYGVIRDIDGRPAIAVRTSHERSIQALATRTTQALVFGALLIGALLTGALFIVLERAIVWPMRRLGGELAVIQDQPTTLRVGVRGGDEVSDVAREVNQMLDRLNAAAGEHARLTGVAQEQQQLAALALDAMSEGLLAFDAQGRCTVCNPAAARLLGISLAVARGRHVTQLLPGIDTAPEPSDPLGPQLLDVAGRTLVITRDASGPVSAARQVAIVLRDVTDVLDIERLRRDVISTVSHELRTPLTAVQATVELLDSDAAREADVHANLVGLLTRNVTRLRHILDDLLTLSALEAASVRLAKDRLDLGMLATRVADDLRPVAMAAGVDLRVETDGDAVAWVDEPRMRQVIENLVQNAIKFSPPGTGVVVAVAGDSANGGPRMTVTDRGPGVSPDELVRVFERFYRSPSAPRDTLGTGLGLPIARMIVELHGGRIWLESDGRSGTTAVVALPAQAA